MVAYHDEEWGVPSHDDRHLFEMLTLEGAQAGLSWSTILRKREGYRARSRASIRRRSRASSSEDVERLLADPGIVRNRLKVESTVNNARACSRCRRSSGASTPTCGLRRTGADRQRWRTLAGAAGGDRPLEGALEGPEAARVPLRRSDRRLRVHAVGRHGRRPHGRLLPPRAVSGDGPDPVRAERRRQHRLPGHGRRAVRPRPRPRLLLAPRDRLGAAGIAHVNDRLGSFARLIRFDKRGTGLSDRSVGLPDFETRMDDVRAVMDAVGSESACALRLLGGRPAVRPLRRDVSRARTRALVLYGTYAKRRDPDDDYPWAPTWEERVRDRRASSRRRGVRTSISGRCGRAPIRPRPRGSSGAGARALSPAGRAT